MFGMGVNIKKRKIEIKLKARSIVMNEEVRSEEVAHKKI